MTSGEKSQKVAELAAAIMKHKHSYYGGEPEISDLEYDRLEQQLTALDPSHPALAAVGTETVSGQKASHQQPMLSLQKVYEFSELEAWRADQPLVGTWKVDGNSLSLIYTGGSLELAKTRGNGRIGEDVTSKARWISDLVPRLDKSLDVEIRGELYCSNRRFAHLAEEMLARGLDRPSNPRNIVAGMLGRKVHFDLCRYFNFLAFDVIVLGQDSAPFKDEISKFGWLADRGFSIPEPQLLNSREEVEAYLLDVKGQLDEMDVGLDGAVFSINSLQRQGELGSTSHHPRFKMGFKWAGETKVVRVKEVHWDTSRHGVVTPVARIEPCFLSGATITNVTLHNAGHVRAYDIAAEDSLEIVRSGEVIPKFLRVVSKGPNGYVWPDRCLACGSELLFDDVRLLCQGGASCPKQMIGSILNWIRALEIDDLSEKRLDAMIISGLVKSIDDLYRLDMEDLLTLPLTKEKMATKLFENITSSKSAAASRFFTGLGIPGMGLTSWEKLLDEFSSMESILGASKQAISEVKGFAEKTAEDIHRELQRKRPLIDRLLELGVSPVFPEATGKGGKLVGRQFVITGTLSQPRSQLEAVIKDQGGTVVSAVSKKVDVLICNDPTSTSSKMKKAKQLGISIWQESDLWSAIGE